MIIDNVSVVVNIVGMNKKNYSKVLGQELKSGDIIKIDQKQLLPTSRTLVWCECDICGDAFTRRMNDVLQKKRTIESPTMCGNECKKEYMRRNNPNPKKDKIEVSCFVCHEKMIVNEYVFKLNNFHFCSRDCYSKHKTGILYEGRKLRTPNIKIECEVCQKKYLIADIGLPDDVRHFCSRQCLNSILGDFKNPNFHFYIYKNGGRRKTQVEIKVGNFLRDNNINYVEEYSIDEIYFVDFYLPDYNFVLEVFGDYWHANPKIYGENDLKKLHEKQRKKKDSDLLRDEYLKESGYEIYCLWEQDLKIDFDKELGNFIEILNKQESSTTNTPNPFKYKG